MRASLLPTVLPCLLLAPRSPPPQLEASRPQLSSIGRSALLPGEAERSKKDDHSDILKPSAHCRLILFYGVGDISIKFSKWIKRAPEWLEVRVVELPGHGYRAEEVIPPAGEQREALSANAIQQDLVRLGSQLCDELTPLLDVPYHILGFSLGAMVAYTVTLELQQRAVPLPRRFFAVGRGAPHLATIPEDTFATLQAGPEEAILAWVSREMSFPIDKLPAAAARRARAVSLFRFGALMGAVPYGAPPRLLPTGERFADDWAAHVCKCHHCLSPPPLLPRVVAIGSDSDAVWPAALHGRWADVADGGFALHEFEGISHPALMNARETQEVVWDEIRVDAAHRMGTAC